MIAPYQNRYLLIVFLTGLITWAQMSLMEIPYRFLNFLYIFMTQLIAPIFYSGILLIILWYTGKKMKPVTVFYTYLIAWILNIAISFYIILSGSYDAYIFPF